MRRASDFTRRQHPALLTRVGAWVLVALSVAAFGVPAPAAELGAVNFPTSGTPEAQAAFLDGVLWLHSFEYEEARKHFRQAREIEPGFVMAAWGEAMSYNYPIWMYQDLEPAREALARLAPTREERLAKAPTLREGRYLEAVEILFGDGEKEERDIAYSGAMEALARDHPGDLEAASFYALSLLGTCHDGRDVATYMRAAAVVEEVFAKNPKHPGAAHYLIHSYDDPVHAPLGLRAARVYAGLAPAAEHALHMPSHIFLALGMWAETAASNEDSFQAAEARVKEQGQSSERRGYHAMLWLHYAYLQQGRFEEASQLLDSIQRDLEEHPSVRTRSHYVQMRAQEIVATREWEELRPSTSLDGLRDGLAATDHFATGYAAVHQGQLIEAKAALAALEELAPATPEKKEDTDLEVEVYRLELAGLIAVADRRGEEGLEQLLEAASLEEQAPFGFGPPLPVKPAHELLGEYLTKKRRFEAAKEHYEKALERAPRRASSLRGLAEVLCARGGRDAASAVLATLAQVGERADQRDYSWTYACGTLPEPSAGGTSEETAHEAAGVGPTGAR